MYLYGESGGSCPQISVLPHNLTNIILAAIILGYVYCGSRTLSILYSSSVRTISILYTGGARVRGATQ